MNSSFRTRQDGKNKIIVIATSLCFIILIYFYFTKSPATPSTNDHANENTLLEKVFKEKEQLERDITKLEKDILNKEIIPVQFPEPFEIYNDKPTSTISKDEKFITYLPHSGFHNQRIELENALLLANYLNRTLLLPNVYLGNPAFPWLRFDKMYERLILQTKNGLEYCSEMRPDEPLPEECLNYQRWTTIPWSFFYDLKKFRDINVRIIFRQDLSFEWLKHTFTLEDKDIYLFKDYSPFEFRVYDLPESRTPLTRFVNRIDLVTLESIEERVIHFGSIFGSYRVLAQSPEHQKVLTFIRENMIFQNQILLDTASSIVNQLGGVGSFVGIHLRVGDGLFKVRASINIDDIYHELVNLYTDLTEEELKLTYDREHDQDRLENNGYEIRQLRTSGDEEEGDNAFDKPILVEHPADIEDRLGKSLLEKCRDVNGDDRVKRFAKTTLFIATDCPNPREHPLLRKIFATFPCVFVLSDFKKELADLGKIQVIEEKIKLESYLIPMVDAIISSQGKAFYGTNSSTFSTYIERQLHPVYTHQPLELLGAPLP